MEAVQPQLKLLEQFVSQDLQSVFRIDALATSHPISIPVKHPDEINEIFDRISYAKGKYDLMFWIAVHKPPHLSITLFFSVIDKSTKCYSFLL